MATCRSWMPARLATDIWSIGRIWELGNERCVQLGWRGKCRIIVIVRVIVGHWLGIHNSDAIVDRRIAESLRVVGPTIKDIRIL